MSIVPLFGHGYKGKSAPVTAQRRINLYGEMQQDGDKSNYVLYPRPGLNPQLFTKQGLFGGPSRGVIATSMVVNPGSANQTNIDLVFTAAGSTAFVAVNNPTQFLNAPNTFQTSTGLMVYADNGYQILGVDGKSAYVAPYSSFGYSQTDISTLGVANFPYGANWVASLGGRFIAPALSTAGKFQWSAIDDYSSWNALDFATAESIPDPLVGGYVFKGQLILFGPRSIEWWALTGDVNVFGRVQGTGQNWGLYQLATLQEADDVLIFCANRDGFETEVVMMQGYQIYPISTPDVEYDLNNEITNNGGSNLVGTVVRSVGHTFYVLSLSTKSWVYDFTTKQWDEWQTDGGRWAGQFSFRAFGRVSITDYRDGRVYGFSPFDMTDNGNAITRQFDTRHVFQQLERMTIWRLVLDMETGTYTVPAVYPTGVINQGTLRQFAGQPATTTASFTVEGWVVSPEMSGGFPYGILNKTVPAGNDWRVQLEAGPQLRMISTSGFSAVIPLTSMDFTNVPFHFAFVYDSVAQTLTAYLNTVQVAQTTAVTDMGGTSTTTNLNIGNGAGVSNFAGSVGGFRIWNGALSQPTIAANWQTALPSLTTNMLTQYWDFTPVGSTGGWTNTGTSGANSLVGAGLSVNHTGYVITAARAPVVMLSISRDGGRTFGSEIWCPIGQLGQYLARVEWRRLGRGRDFVFRFRMTDPARVAFINGAIDVAA